MGSILAVFVSVIFTQGSPAATALKDAVAGLMPQLDQLAQWCQQQRLPRERDQVLGLMIQFDPEHLAARKALKFSKEKGGDWRQDPAYREPKDTGDPAPFAAQRAAVIAPFRTAMLALIDSTANVTGEDRAAACQCLLKLDADDAQAHAALGEARGRAGAWVLAETVTAKARRAELYALSAACLQEANVVKTGTPTDFESKLGVTWQAVNETPAVRVLGTGPPEEEALVAQANEAAAAFFRQVFHCQTSLWSNYTLFVLANAGDKEVLIERHPSLTAEYRKFLLQLNSGGFPGTPQWGHWGPDQARRLDSSVRSTFGCLFAREFGIEMKHGWVFEGFGLYLARELIGTRLTWFAHSSATSPQEEKLRSRLVKPDTNWMKEIAKVLTTAGNGWLAALLKKDVSEMNTEDMLSAYLLAAYLLESHASEVPGILRHVGKGEAAGSVLSASLKTELAPLEQRLRHWLDERR